MIRFRSRTGPRLAMIEKIAVVAALATVEAHGNEPAILTCL